MILILIISIMITTSKSINVGGWSELNVTDPKAIEIASFCINQTFLTYRPFQFEIISIKQQVVSGMNYNLTLKTYFRRSTNTISSLISSMKSLIFFRYNIYLNYIITNFRWSNYTTNEFLFNWNTSTVCYSKDGFIVWDRFGDMKITNHTIIQKTCNN